MTLFNQEQLKRWKIADWGYVVDPLPASFTKLKNWVESKEHEPLGYLADHRLELRKDLRKFYPEFQSSLVFLFTYAAEKKALDQLITNDPSWNGLKIASYTLGFEGEDYHHLLKRNLCEIGEHLKTQVPDLNYALTLDVHPVLERDLAYRSGLGWFGKNSMLIHQQEGSFVMIGSLLLNQKLEVTTKSLQVDHCGNCRACVEICPTDAIDESARTITAQKCISTFTIELFDQAQPILGHVEKGTGEIFGCDLCQDVCPWNKRKLKLIDGHSVDQYPKAKMITDFFLRTPLKVLISSIEKMGVREFRRHFAQTSFERSGKKGLLKNLYLFNRS